MLEGKTYSGAELILTPPATPESVLIDEGMVSNMLNEYKSHFLTEARKAGINPDIKWDMTAYSSRPLGRF